MFHEKRHPRDMAEAEVAVFLTSLAQRRSVSASTQNRALAALVVPLQGGAGASARLGGRRRSRQATTEASVVLTPGRGAGPAWEARGGNKAGSSR